MTKNLHSNHGGNILSYEKDLYDNVINADAGNFNFQKLKIIDFSASINPFGLSKNAVKIIKNYKLIKIFVENYPESYSEALTATLSVYHNVGKGSLFLGAGATDLIFNIAQVIRPKTVIIVEPSFLEYERAAKSVKSSLIRINTYSGDNFKLSGKSYLNLLKNIEKANKNDLVFIASPSNPAGIITPFDNIKEILNLLKKRGAFLVLDESFMDFCERFSAKGMIDEYNNLIIVRSLTKFFAMPGERLGYIIANNKTIKKFSKDIIPWKITGLGTAIAISSLNSKDYIANILQKLKKIKYNLHSKLRDLGAFEVIRGEANFFLMRIKLRGFNALDLKNYLVKSGILIRYCGNYHGLNDKYFRIAVRKKSENDYLISKLKELVKSGYSHPDIQYIYAKYRRPDSETGPLS
ncbi:MAG: aminotransferase class I/II-fold pyridoxal phosphate-dependent enzyme [Deltaproteobacteria bacterium]|nr:aminotransferase class I/II-fold pyridoxal phosphate-dependent enzyme [Deltaproteobacteria bacterium]